MTETSGKTIDLGTPAWLLDGLFRTEPGELELREGNLRFRTAAGFLFDVAVGDLSYVEFPWLYFGAGIRFRIGGREYRFSFMPPTSEGGSVLDIARGRGAGRAWRSALREAGVISPNGRAPPVGRRR